MGYGRVLTGGLIALAIAAALGCQASPQPAPAPAGKTATFVDTVWRVSASSSVEPGMLYVFLSDGTLVISSPHGRPALGTWQRAGDGLTMTEEGMPYKVDVLALDASQFRIRIHNPGPAVEITFVRAEESAPPPAAR